jgi:hypothetical protein
MKSLYKENVMRRFVFAVLALALFLPLTAQAQQTPSPEHQHLGIWVGNWTYEVTTGSGTMEGEWFGEGFFVQSRETYTTTSGVTTQMLHVFGYNVEEETYSWHRYLGNGNIQLAKGWVSDNDWTFLFDEQAGTRVRMTIIEESAEVMSFTWARSVKGGPWEVTNEGRMTKVR